MNRKEKKKKTTQKGTEMSIGTDDPSTKTHIQDCDRLEGGKIAYIKTVKKCLVVSFL